MAPLSQESAANLFTLAETAGDILFNLTDTLHGLSVGRMASAAEESTSAAVRELTELRGAVAMLVRAAQAAGLIAEGA